MRYIDLDINRDFKEVAVDEPGHPVRSRGRIVARPAELQAFAATCTTNDAVVLAATINTWVMARLLGEHRCRVDISNPYRTRAIAETKIWTDRVDATVLAQLLVADYLPSVWGPDGRTQKSRGPEPYHATRHRQPARPPRAQRHRRVARSGRK